MSKSNKYHFKISFFLSVFCSLSLYAISQTVSLNITNDSTYYPGTKKTYINGLNREHFLDACAIQWLPVKNNFPHWVYIEPMLEQQLVYSDFDRTIRFLANSAVVKAYSASIKTEDGREVYCLEIGNGSKTVIFTAGVHAREVANPQFMLNFAIRIVSDYENGSLDIKDILSKVKLVILPCVNPDGYNAAILGNSAINNKALFIANLPDSRVKQGKSNARGVDLNRNFPTYSAALLWENQKERHSLIRKERSSLYFSGDSLGSENETKIAMNFLIKYIPTAVRFVDFHSAGSIVYAGKPHLSDAFNELCFKSGRLIRTYSGYRLLELDDEETGNGTDGSITDFAAEIAAGFIYNPLLGRLAPPDSIRLVQKFNQMKYPCSVNTVETLISLPNDRKTGLAKPSTPQMHLNEWNKRHFYSLMLALLYE
ncbi:MAG: M14 family zinc carboxypeptidase [Paludibacteraceae bacterium]